LQSSIERKAYIKRIILRSLKRKLSRKLRTELSEHVLRIIQNAMTISFVIKLLNRVHDKCALCEEIKRLEYLALDDEDNWYDICKQCKEKVARTKHLIIFSE